MSVIRWRLQRLAGWFLPVLVFLLVAIFLLRTHRDAAGETAYVEDDAYRNLVVARTLNEARVYGATPLENCLMVQDTLWRVLVAGTQFAVGDGRVAANLLGLIFGMLTLCLIVRLCRTIFPFPVFGYYAALLLALSPGLAGLALSGTSMPLVICLVTAAVVFHIEGLTIKGKGLSFTVVLMVGLAMWVRLELVVVWLFLWLHTGITALVPADKRPAPATTFFRGLNGLLLLALIILPMLLWNMRLVQVPWPRLVGVPLALDVWAQQGAMDAARLTLGQMQAGWPGIWGSFSAQAPTGGLLAVLLFLVGYGLFLVQVVRSAEDRPYLIFLVAPVAVPLLMAMLYPYFGDRAVPALAQAFRPLFVLVVAYGVIRLPFTLSQLLGGRIPMLASERVRWGWSTGVGSLLLLIALAGQIGEARTYREELMRVGEQRQEVLKVLEQNRLTGWSMLTDQPGWLLWEEPALHLVDLEGEWTPVKELIAAVDEQGVYQTERLLRFAGVVSPALAVAVCWDPHYADLAVPPLFTDPEVLSTGTGEEAAGRPQIIIEAQPAVL
jgi:hypothetical protein